MQRSCRKQHRDFPKHNDHCFAAGERQRTEELPQHDAGADRASAAQQALIQAQARTPLAFASAFQNSMRNKATNCIVTVQQPKPAFVSVSKTLTLVDREA